MSPGNSRIPIQKSACHRPLWVEHLEDRVVPGETLTGLLLLPIGLLPFGQSPGEAFGVSEEPSTSAVTETSGAWDGRQSLLADSVDGGLAVESEGLSLLARHGTDSQAAGAEARTAEPPASVHDLLFPAAASVGGLAGRGWELSPVLGSDPLPQHFARPTSDMNVSSARADLPLPAPPGPSGTTNAAGPVGSNVAGGAGSAALAGVTPVVAVPLLRAQPTRHGGGGGGSPAGYSPSQISHAYGFDKLTQNGAGKTIAIVDAYDDPNIQADLDTFSTKFGLPTSSSGQFTFTKAYAQGSQPSASGGWAQEISLDVEWAHALAPRANILLVEAADSSLTTLLSAVDFAVRQGAPIVSMSWGASEFSGEASFDFHFQVPGVTFLAAAGDTGGQAVYPSASPYVVSVGGTTLPLDSSGNLTGAESAWSSGGGGPSAAEVEPGYQIAYGVTTTGGQRGTPDVAYDANPFTGFAVYDSFAYQRQQGWLVFGGTSAGAPQWAGLVARVDQLRGTPLASSSVSGSPFYSAATGSAYASNYRDITTGSNTVYSTGTGYDLATGLGSPMANNLVPFLATH